MTVIKILVPLNDRKDIISFKQAGADELYLGFYDEQWTQRFGKYADINRMSGFGKLANRYSFSEIPDIIQDIRKQGMDAFVTMNANVYSEKELEWIGQRYFPTLSQAGVSGVIVSDEAIAQCALNAGLKPVASTMMGAYNSDIVSFYRELGIKRIIVPRDLSLEEIAMIRDRCPDVDIEVFFMRNGCVFSDAFCLGTHCRECGSTCGSLKALEKQIFSCSSDFRDRHAIELNDMLYHEAFHNEACGMCALYRLRQIGVTALKIVGRADRPGSVEQDIRLTKENLRILDGCSSEEEFLEKMILPGNSYRQCKLGLCCYYPQVRF